MPILERYDSGVKVVTLESAMFPTRVLLCLNDQIAKQIGIISLYEYGMQPTTAAPSDHSERARSVNG